jgi:hypothetical protein
VPAADRTAQSKPVWMTFNTANSGIAIVRGGNEARDTDQQGRQQRVRQFRGV